MKDWEVSDELSQVGTAMSAAGVAGGQLGDEFGECGHVGGV
jgi:hypothetical protein